MGIGHAEVVFCKWIRGGVAGALGDRREDGVLVGGAPRKFARSTSGGEGGGRKRLRRDYIVFLNKLLCVALIHGLNTSSYAGTLI